MLRAASSIALGILVTCALTLALTTLGGSSSPNRDQPNTWLLGAAVLGASTIPFFLGSMVSAYVGQHSGWKLGIVVYACGAVFFFVALAPASLGETLLERVLTFAMAFGLALLFTLYGGTLGQRILAHRRRTRITVLPSNLEGEAIDANAQEQ